MTKRKTNLQVRKAYDFSFGFMKHKFVYLGVRNGNYEFLSNAQDVLPELGESDLVKLIVKEGELITDGKELVVTGEHMFEPIIKPVKNTAKSLSDYLVKLAKEQGLSPAEMKSRGIVFNEDAFKKNQIEYNRLAHILQEATA